MNKKQYIKPSVLALPISATNMICKSIDYGGEDGGSGTPEARRRIVEDEEDDDSWNW